MNPYQAPSATASPSQSAQQLYARVPVHRRNGTCSMFLLLALVLAFAGPGIVGRMVASSGEVVGTVVSLVVGLPLLAVCVIVLTGDVYFDKLADDGTLKKWGVGNKVVAALILLGWAYSIVRAFV